MLATDYLWMSTCECNAVGGLVSTCVPTFRSHLEITYQYELFNTRMTLFMNESTNEFVYMSIPSLRFLLQGDHVFTLVVLPSAQSMFGLFPFIHVICIISSAHEITKT